MSKTIEISRELAERIAQWGSVSWPDKEELRSILAKSIAEYHEPYGFASALIDAFKSAIENGKQPTFSKDDLNYFIECLSKCQFAAPAVERQEPVAWLDKESGAIVTDKLKPLLAESGFDTPLYTHHPVATNDNLIRLLTRARIYARGEFRAEIDACIDKFKELNK